MKFSLQELRKHRAVLAATGASVGAIVLVTGIVLIATRRQSPVASTTPTPVPTRSATATPTVTATPTPSMLPSQLNGALVPAGTQALHPLAVMIENHPDARPQSGLSQADVVYEAIAEGGITRFMAVFGNPQIPVRVGPVRSARTYFVDFATEYHAMYAHVGGNMDALDQIKDVGGVDNLDQFSVGSPTYARDFSRKVALEHTMYSSTDKLWSYGVNTDHYATAAAYSPWLFKDGASQAASQTVKVNVSSASYDVTWNYNASTNSYKRTMAGAPHIDAGNGKQIEVKDIVLETVNRNSVVTRIGEQGWHYDLTGSGPAVVIQNGVAIKGTWKKSGTERTRYYDEGGKEISFVPGEIWVHVIHSDSKVSY